MGLEQVWIELERLERRRLCRDEVVRYRLVADQAVTEREPRVGQGIRRIDLDGLLQVRQTFFEPFRRHLVQIELPF